MLNGRRFFLFDSLLLLRITLRKVFFGVVALDGDGDLCSDSVSLFASET